MRFKVLKSNVGLVVEIPTELFTGSGSGGGGGGVGPPGPQGPQGPQGIPGTDASTTPLTDTFYVDLGTTVPMGDQDGSIGAPYGTLTAALAAHADVSATFILTPGNYGVESDIALISGSTVEVTIACLTGLRGATGFSGTDHFNANNSAALPGISGLSALSTLHIIGCTFSSKSVSCGGILKMDWCAVFGASGTITGSDAAILSCCTTTRPVVGGASGIFVNQCDFTAVSGTIMSTSGTIIEASLCRFTGTPTIAFTGAAGQFFVDSISNFYWKAATETLTNGTKVVVGDIPLAPLSNTVWVDGGTTVPTAYQNGSVQLPFSTLTAALNAIGSNTRFTIFLTPGDYSGESDIALLSTANISIGIICQSAYYGVGAITPELSATLPGISGGNSTQILHVVNCIWNDRPVTPAGTLRADFCRFLGTPGVATVTANNISTNYSTFFQRISTTSTVAARNCAFLGTGAIITVDVAGGIVQAYLCSFDPTATISIEFTGAGGEFRIDGVTNFHWKAATETLTGGTLVVQDNITP